MVSMLYFIWLVNPNYFSCCSWLMLKTHFNLWLSEVFCCPQEEGSFPVRIALCCAWDQKEYCQLKIPSFPKCNQPRAASAPMCTAESCRTGDEVGTHFPLRQRHWTGQHHNLRLLPLSSSFQHWDVFRTITEVFILVPALVGLKGNLEMTLASRLSTAVSVNKVVCVWGRGGTGRRHQEILLLYNHTVCMRHALFC